MNCAERVADGAGPVELDGTLGVLRGNLLGIEATGKQTYNEKYDINI